MDDLNDNFEGDCTRDCWLFSRLNQFLLQKVELVEQKSRLVLAMFSTTFSTWMGSRYCCRVSPLADLRRFLSLSSFLCFRICNFSDIRVEIVLKYSWLIFLQGLALLSYTRFGFCDLIRSSLSLLDKQRACQLLSNPMIGVTSAIHPFLSMNSPNLPFFRWKATELFNMLICNFVRSSSSSSLCRLQDFL